MEQIFEPNMTKYTLSEAKGFTVINNRIFFEENNLSENEKYLLLLMLALPKTWHFSIEGMSKLVKYSKNTLASYLRDLEKYGYFYRSQDHIDGRYVKFHYEVYEAPELNPHFQGTQNNIEQPLLNTNKITGDTNEGALENSELEEPETLENKAFSAALRELDNNNNAVQKTAYQNLGTCFLGTQNLTTIQERNILNNNKLNTKTTTTDSISEKEDAAVASDPYTDMVFKQKDMQKLQKQLNDEYTDIIKQRVEYASFVEKYGEKLCTIILSAFYQAYRNNDRVLRHFSRDLFENILLYMFQKIDTINKPDAYACARLNALLKKYEAFDDLKTKPESTLINVAGGAGPGEIKNQNSFTNFQQRTYDYEELEKKILANK